MDVPHLLPPNLQTLCITLNASRDLREKLEQVAITAAELTGSDHAEVTLIDLLLRRFLSAESSRVSVRRTEDEATRWIREHRQPLIVPDLNFATSDAELALQEDDIASYMGVPIITEDSVLGALLIFNKDQRPYNRGERQTLDALAALAATAITQQKLVSQVESGRRTLLRLSLTDPLTGVASKQQFVQMLNREWQHAVTRGLPISLMQLEIDAFENYLEHHGRGKAQNLLLRAAQALNAALYRSGDLVARVDDTILVMLLPETDLAGAKAIAERLRREVAEATPRLNGIPLTLSIGISSFDTLRLQQGKMCTPDTLFKQSLEALKEAKEAGGNRVPSIV